jgi:hypothetical protein
MNDNQENLEPTDRSNHMKTHKPIGKRWKSWLITTFWASTSGLAWRPSGSIGRCLIAKTLPLRYRNFNIKGIL